MTDLESYLFHEETVIYHTYHEEGETELEGFIIVTPLHIVAYEDEYYTGVTPRVHVKSNYSIEIIAPEKPHIGKDREEIIRELNLFYEKHADRPGDLPGDLKLFIEHFAF